MTGEKKLLPCPFCGGKAFMWTTNDTLTVECEHYHVDKHRVMLSGRFGGDVIDAWNRRASGKADRNGRPIYSGDRISMQSTGKTGEVYYSTENAAFEVRLDGGVCLGLDAESGEYEVMRDE